MTTTPDDHRGGARLSRGGNQRGPRGVGRGAGRDRAAHQVSREGEQVSASITTTPPSRFVRISRVKPDKGNRSAVSHVSTDVETWTPPTWDAVVREHSARVYRLAYRLTGNQHDAEDLTQEVFVRVFRSLHDYQPGTFEGWLHRITTNLFLDMVRRRARIRFEGLPDDAERIKGREASPAQVYDDTHLDHDVQTALDALLPEYRAAVVLCDIEGLTYEEIADVLGIKLGTVRSRIHRGRTQLRAALAHRAPRAPGVPGEATP